jgi:hypothetical protein
LPTDVPVNTAAPEGCSNQIARKPEICYFATDRRRGHCATALISQAPCGPSGLVRPIENRAQFCTKPAAGKPGLLFSASPMPCFPWVLHSFAQTRPQPVPPCAPGNPGKKLNPWKSSVFIRVYPWSHLFFQKIVHSFAQTARPPMPCFPRSVHSPAQTRNRNGGLNPHATQTKYCRLSKIGFLPPTSTPGISRYLTPRRPSSSFFRPLIRVYSRSFGAPGQAWLI